MLICKGFDFDFDFDSYVIYFKYILIMNFKMFINK